MAHVVWWDMKTQEGLSLSLFFFFGLGDCANTLVIGENEYSLGHFGFEVFVEFPGEAAIRQDWTLSCLLTWIIGRI